jgi:large subunit ribosomal protein L29
MKKNDELRVLSGIELNEELISLRQKQFMLRMKRANGSLEKPHHITQVRRAIARVKTIMTEKGRASHVK